MPQSQKPQDCGLFPVRKDNIRAYLTVISGIMMPPAGVDRAWDEGRQEASHTGWPPQIAAVIPSRAIRRVAAIDDEGRGLAAAIMRDQPVVVLNWFAGGT